MALAGPADWLMAMTDHLAGRALVVYASTHGHTARIAARLAQAMREQGVDADLRDVAQSAPVEPDGYGLVVAGGSLHREHHQQALVAWATAHRGRLSGLPTAFFSVSLSAADDGVEARAATQRCIDEFCAQTGWTPGRCERIAGCLQYREYDPFTRQLMRLMMKRMGHPTDTSQDHDYTDWDAVDRLGRELAQLVAPVAVGS
ncbi:MAG: menaquinone-dependent protoporphyrinogen oxidase [Solirubrobacteraceae bacterium]|nr:menaquinone-dependent protoporphyrinogen oxidase [Solirubrobacteraceae bacterium]